MTTITTVKGNYYTFYLVDECYNYQDSPYGKNTICIPIQGMRTNCASHNCDLCELQDTSNCSLLYEQQPKAIALFNLPNLRNTHPHLFI